MSSTSTPTSTPTTTRTKLIGTWTLQTMYMHPACDPSEKHYPLGANACGRLTFSPTGYMTVILSRSIHDSSSSSSSPHAYFTFATETFPDASADGKATASTQAIAYTGEWFLVVDDDDGKEEAQQQRRPMLLHHIQYATVPDWVGTVQRRVLTWDSDVVGEEPIVGMTLETVPDGKASRSALNGMVSVLRWKKEGDMKSEVPARELWD